MSSPSSSNALLIYREIPSEPLLSFLLPSRSRAYPSISVIISGKNSRQTNLASLVLPTLKNLGHALIFIVSAEFVLQSGFASSIQDTLGAVAETVLEHEHLRKSRHSTTRVSLRVSHEDFPPVQDITEGNAAVFLPFL